MFAAPKPIDISITKKLRDSLKDKAAYSWIKNTIPLSKYNVHCS